LRNRLVVPLVVVPLVVVLLGAVATGCSVRLPQTYVLSATSAAASPRSGPVVGVGPVTLPAYLDQRSIVVREASGEVRLSRVHQWAEPLQDGVARVIAENLALMIPTDAVVVFPWRSPRTVAFRVTMDILDFDGPLGGPVGLNAQWRLLDGNGKELVLRAVTLDEPAAEPTYAALVASQNRLLTAVSRDIAAAIRARTP
jgi:uncharacterized lipoprotein YmbA